MRIIYVLLAVASLALVGCSDSDSNVNLGQNGNGNNGGGGNGGNASDLSSLVINQCNKTPEDQDPIAINGRSFGPGANDPSNQMFTNNCL